MMAHQGQPGRWARLALLARLVLPATKAIPALQVRRVLKVWSARQAPLARQGTMELSVPLARWVQQESAAQRAQSDWQGRKV